MGPRRRRRLGPRPRARGGPGQWAGRPPDRQPRLAGRGIDHLGELLRAEQGTSCASSPATTGQVVSDFTTRATEDEFTTFPGFLDQAAFYRTALQNGGAKQVGEGTWRGRPVYWVQLEKGGGLQLRIGLDRDSYRPIVFRGVNPNGTPAGFQLAVLGLDYVSPDAAAFDTDAPVLVRGTVLGEGCRPTRARIDAFLTGSTYSKAAIASGRAGADGRFTLRAEPANVPGGGFRDFRLNVQSARRLRVPTVLAHRRETGAGLRPPRSGSSSTRRVASGVTPPARRPRGRARRRPVGPRSAAKRPRRPPPGHRGGRARATRAR